MLRKFNQIFSKSVFGATSAIITNLALIIGLDHTANAKFSIIGGLLVIAIADNISDTLGIHIYKEAETTDKKEIFTSTVANFSIRFAVSLVFILLIILLPLEIAAPISIIYGLLILTIISFTIAKKNGINPYYAVLKHIFVAIIVIIASNYLGKLIISKFTLR